MENPSPPPPNPALPYREDCWSQGATSTLIDAWGNRYLDFNRGNLRQKQWQEVADAVNSRRTAVKRPRRTDVQCKNRIDTLKKKYKSEKAKIAGSGGIHSSRWPFYDRLDALIGPAVAAKPSSPPPPMALPLPYPKNPNYPLPQAVAVLAKRPYPEEQILRKGNYLAAAAAAAKSAEEDSESFKSSPERIERSGRKEANGVGENSGDGVREVAKAIASFAEIYEKVELDNQRLMVEVERQRMEFMKALEFQRMKMFVDMHVQLQKVKRTKRAVSGPAAAKHSYPDNR